MEDNGRMAAVFAPLEEIERILKTVNGYVVIANVNSNRQAVIGGASQAVEQAMEAFQKAGYDVVCVAGQPRFPYLDRGRSQRAAAASSGAPASAIAAFADRRQYERRVLSDGAGRRRRRCWTFSRGRSLLQCSSLRACARCTMPALASLSKLDRRKRCRDLPRTCSAHHGDVVSLFTNHPKVGDIAAFNQALCGLYAAGLGRGTAEDLRKSTVATMSAFARRSR